MSMAAVLNAVRSLPNNINLDASLSRSNELFLGSTDVRGLSPPRRVKEADEDVVEEAVMGGDKGGEDGSCCCCTEVRIS